MQSMTHSRGRADRNSDREVTEPKRTKEKVEISAESGHTEAIAIAPRQMTEGNIIGGPGDLLPGTGQQRITRSRLDYPSSSLTDDCQWSITKLSFFCLHGTRLLGGGVRNPIALSVVRSSDYPEPAVGNLVHTYFGGLAACC